MIRPGRIEDLPALTAIYNHWIRTSPVTFDIDEFSVAGRREWFSHYRETGPHRLLVAEVDGVAAAYATSSVLRPKPAYLTSVETTVYVSPEHLGQGLGRRLYRALFEALAGEDVHRAYAGIALPNDASLALHYDSGFTELGTYTEVGFKFGRYHDVVWLEKRLG